MKPHEEWLLKAEHDLLSAIKLIQGEAPLTDTAIFHTQQCAEKIFKAFLSFHDREIVKTHHLKSLLEQCIVIDPSFQSLTLEANYLSPFATLFRYPDETLFPDKEDVETAIEKARTIFSFVKDKISQ